MEKRKETKERYEKTEEAKLGQEEKRIKMEMKYRDRSYKSRVNLIQR